MTTITAYAASVGPTQPNNGAGGFASWYQGTGATSIGAAGDQIVVARIPANCRIYDAAVSVVTAATNQTVNVLMVNGAGGSGTVTLITSLSTSAGGTLARITDVAVGCGLTKANISDSNALQYASIVIAFTAGTATTSFVTSGYVLFGATGNDF